MKPNIETIFDIAVGLGYKVNLCATKSDIETGLFKFKKMKILVYLLLLKILLILFICQKIHCP